MKTLVAVGDFPAATAPTLAVSGGRDGVHLILRDYDEEDSRSVMAWFDTDELLAAIDDTRATHRRPARLAEPAGDAA